MIENREETFMQTVFILNEVTYVPHYRNPSVFVGPGYPIFNKERYSQEQLVAGGAKRSALALWKRSTYGVVTDQNP
jgi:hypothetical protein